MTERFVLKFSQLHRDSPVYLMAEWVLGGHVGKAR